jgi:two-component system chemotaxis sensor kinase CheA
MEQSFNEKILLIDDDPDILESLSILLTMEGTEVVACSSAEEGLRLLSGITYFLVLCDFRMPGMNGIEFAREFRKFDSQTPFVIVTGYSDREIVLNGIRAGVNDFIDKPIDPQKFMDTVQKYKKSRLDQILQDKLEIETIRNLFVEEANDIVSHLEESIFRLESNPGNKAEINLLYRRLHTLKGSSGSIQGAQPITDLAHAFESVLSALKEGQIEFSQALCDVMLSSVDILKLCVGAIEKNGDFPAVKEQIEAFEQTLVRKLEPTQGVRSVLRGVETVERREESDEGVVVSNEKLDDFMELAGELVAFKNAFYGFIKQQSSSQSLDEELLEMYKALSKLAEDLQNQIMDVRKISLQKAFAKLPRMVRQIAQDLDKNVRYETQGLELQVDKTVAKALAGSLVHVVRNSCDHGLESANERRKLGKSEVGRITVKASQEGDLVFVQVSDDGRGLNRDRILEKAREKGLVTDEHRVMSDQDVYELVFLPGFSTADTVSGISGRGVGMDVVKTAAINLGGQIRLESQPGKGTILTFVLPVPKSIIVEQSIVAKTSEQLLAIPLACIAEIRRADVKDLTFIHPYWTLNYRDRPIPIVTYEELLAPERINPSHASIDQKELVIVVTHKNAHIALRVQCITDQLEAVVRPFDRITLGVPGFKGTSQLPGDELAFMLSAEDLVGMSQRGSNYRQKAA